MENQIALTPEKQEAVELDTEIRQYISTAWQMIVAAGKCLKKMKVNKLYLQLGYDSFDDYSSKSFGFQERQAYNYISVYEKLGDAFLQSTANLGITKLELLTHIPAPDRQDIVDQNDIAGMTVEEVKKLVAENDAKGEQITMLSDQLEDKKNDLDEVLSKEKDHLSKISDLERQLEEERDRPIEMAVQEPDQATLDKIRADAQKEAAAQFKAEKKQLSDKLKAEKDKAVSDAAEKAKSKISEFKKKLEELDVEKAAATLRAEQLEKKLIVSSSPETVKFSFYYEDLKRCHENLFDSISAIRAENPENAQKYATALKKYTDIVLEKLATMAGD